MRFWALLVKQLFERAPELRKLTHVVFKANIHLLTQKLVEGSKQLPILLI